MTYKNNQEHGKYIEWNDSGKKIKEGSFNYGKWNDLWTAWDDDGKKIKEMLFKDGNKIWEKIY